MSNIIAYILSVFTAFSLLFNCATPFHPNYPDAQTHTKTVFDEGTFVMKSVDIVVSPDGNDHNPGSIDAPMKTPDAAKEKAKILKNTNCGHVTVWFRQGTYELTKTLAFDKEDCNDITYRSYPGETVIFSGGKQVTNFTETTVNGVKAFVSDYGINSESDFINALYSDSERLSRAVYPKQGEFSVAGVLSADALYPENTLFDLHAAFYADKANASDFKNINDVDVRILHYWKDELLPISSIDAATGRIELQKPSSMSISKGDRFFFENVFEALSEPGEWYLDRSDEKLYYIPFDGQTAETTILNAGVLENLITIDECSNIDFQGIDFKYSGWNVHSGEHFNDYKLGKSNPLFSNILYAPDHPQACYDSPCAVTVTSCNNVNFTDCEFNLIGTSALMFGEGTHDCTLKSSLFDNIGGNVVYIKGANERDTSESTSNITVTDCHIKTYGRVFNNAIGVLLINAYDCNLSQNEIHDGFYTAISSGWVWGYGENVTDNIKIENNLIYDIGQGWLSDMGGIYTLGVQPNSVIRGNVIHNVGCYSGGSGYGGWGIYLDEGSSEILVENNLVYKCTSEGFYQHYGKDNMVRNNIFALNDSGQILVSDKEDHNSLYLYNNILLSDNTVMYTSVQQGKFIDKENLYWDCTRKKLILSGTNTSLKNRETITAMINMGYYNDAVIANPLFKDAENGDFTLALNSPAIGSGFVPWDYSEAGTISQF